MNYRDDVVEVITTSDGTQSTLKMTLGERLTTRDVLGNQNKEWLNEVLRLSEYTDDRTVLILDDYITVGDGIFDKQISRQMVVDGVGVVDTISRVYRDDCLELLRVGDTIKQTLTAKAIISDEFAIKDENRHTIKDTLSDGAKAIGSTNSDKKLGDVLAEFIRAKDGLMYGVREMVGESLTVATNHSDKQKAKNLLSERLMMGDGIVEQFKKTSHLDDVISIGDEIFDKLIAKNMLTERAMVAVLDGVVQDSPNMAWTMNTVNQAMSQYAPYDIDRVAVVGGVLYGESKDGVYRLDGVDETITGVLMMDKVDYGENLIKPAYAYTEYRTDGAVKLTVHTTQKGVAQKYTYALPKERAGELTNGRFVFGRGLYGRHFAYTLHITAKQAFLHDLNIHFEQTSRRL